MSNNTTLPGLTDDVTQFLNEIGHGDLAEYVTASLKVAYHIGASEVSRETLEKLEAVTQ